MVKADSASEEPVAMIERGECGSVEGVSAERVARLKASFPTPRAAFAYVMNTSPIVRRKDEEKVNGDYRTKLQILNIYDLMQEAIGSGRPYETILSPPPADPRCCHPPREGGRW